MDSTYVNYLRQDSVQSNNWILRPFLFLFVIFALFPYVKVIPTETDTQPNALLLAVILLAILFRGQRLPKAIFWLWLLPPVALAIFAVEALRMSDLTNSIRSVYNYFALPIIATTVALERRTIQRFLVPFLNAATIVYFLIALAQLVTGDQFVGNFVGGGLRWNPYDSAYRGTVGLAPEPTAYATILFLFLILYSILGKEKSWGAALCLIQILFFARSSTVIMMIVVVLVIRALIARQFEALVVGTLAVLFLTVPIFTLKQFSESRVRGLMVQLINDPARILDNDFSVLSRAGHAWYGSMGILQTYGAPNGFSAFSDYYNEKIEGIDWLRPRAKAGIRISPEVRIVSGLGAVFFELGLLGLIVPITLWRLVRHRYQTVFSAGAITSLLGLGLVALASGVPIGFPPLALAFGLLAGRDADTAGVALTPANQR